MDRENWLNKAENDFFDVVVNGGGLDDLSDVAYKYLGNPIMITNERGLVFGKARGNVPYDDVLFDEFDEKGYVPREKFFMTSAEIFADQLRNGEIVILEKAYVSHRLMIYQDIIGNDFILKCVMLESKRPFSKTDEQMFTLFAKTARYYLLNSTLVKSFRSNSVECFFYEALIGHIDCINNEREVTEYLGVVAYDRRSLLVVKNAYVSAAPVILSEARTVLEGLFNGCISIIDGDCIVLLIHSEDLADTQLCLKKASAYFRKNNMRGCVSHVFESLRYLPMTYQQVREVLELGIKLCADMHLFYYSDMAIYSIYSRLDDNALDTNCYLPVLDLLEADRTVCLELMPTLYAYALTFGNCSRASRLLGIHYNSTKSRLAKIEEIIGCRIDGILPALYSSIIILLLKEYDAASKYVMIEQFNREMLEEKRGVAE